jgi:hypothetical protein
MNFRQRKWIKLSFVYARALSSPTPRLQLLNLPKPVLLIVPAFDRGGGRKLRGRRWVSSSQTGRGVAQQWHAVQRDWGSSRSCSIRTAGCGSTASPVAQRHRGAAVGGERRSASWVPPSTTSAPRSIQSRCASRSSCPWTESASGNQLNAYTFEHRWLYDRLLNPQR